METESAAAMRRFQLILVKPSHYDDDGYVIRWYRSMIPSNSLASVFAIAMEAAGRLVLGDDVTLDIYCIDETNTRVDIPALLARFQLHGNFGMLGLIGVQSNQFPRALDIARPFRAAGVPVAVGGFHVSGVISMIDEHALGLDACRELGIAMFAGELEGRIDGILQDAASGTLQPVYNYMDDLPGISDTPVPFLPKHYAAKTIGTSTSFDAGRGCPYQCSFCTIINVQGRKSRYRTPDDVEQVVRMNWAQGISKFFITDDNFARNRDWERIFDRLITLREDDKIPLGLMIQVDTLCHRIPRFIAKAKRAGVTRVFIGLENINPDNLLAAKKRQNKIAEYRKMLLAWKAVGIITLAGYILGFPADTPDSIRHDIEVIKRELPLDILEFFCLTPLPGSEDHQKLWRAGVEMDLDLNRYDVEHVCAAAPEDEPRAVGVDLSRGLGALLHRGPHAHAAQARLGHRAAADEPAEAAADLLADGPDRARASAPERHLAAEAPAGAAPRLGAPEPDPILGRIRMGDGAKARPDRAPPGFPAADAARRQAREGIRRLHRPRADLGRAGGGSEAGAACAGDGQAAGCLTPGSQ